MPAQDFAELQASTGECYELDRDSSQKTSLAPQAEFLNLKSRSEVENHQEVCSLKKQIELLQKELAESRTSSEEQVSALHKEIEHLKDHSQGNASDENARLQAQPLEGQQVEVRTAADKISALRADIRNLKTKSQADHYLFRRLERELESSRKPEANEKAEDVHLPAKLEVSDEIKLIRDSLNQLQAESLAGIKRLEDELTELRKLQASKICFPSSPGSVRRFVSVGSPVMMPRALKASSIDSSALSTSVRHFVSVGSPLMMSRTIKASDIDSLALPFSVRRFVSAGSPVMMPRTIKDELHHGSFRVPIMTAASVKVSGSALPVRQIVSRHVLPVTQIVLRAKELEALKYAAKDAKAKHEKEIKNLHQQLRAVQKVYPVLLYVLPLVQQR